MEEELQTTAAQTPTIDPRVDIGHVHLKVADIEREVARLKLESMGVHIAPMTPEQKAYSESWESGT